MQEVLFGSSVGKFSVSLDSAAWATSFWLETGLTSSIEDYILEFSVVIGSDLTVGNSSLNCLSSPECKLSIVDFALNDSSYSSFTFEQGKLNRFLEHSSLTPTLYFSISSLFCSILTWSVAFSLSHPSSEIWLLISLMTSSRSLPNFSATVSYTKLRTANGQM